MKPSFLTGLAILLPVAVTVLVVIFVVNLLTGPFTGMVGSIFDRYHLFEKGFLFLSSDQLRHLIGQVSILVSLVLFTIFLGFITQWFFVHYFIQFWDKLIHRIPFISSIYKICQDVIKTIFGSDTQSFKQVVLAPFPNPDTYSIGLVTRESFPVGTSTPFTDLTGVFVPTTPNPTSGFLIFCKPAELIYLDMQIEEAFKYVISCGVISTSFRSITKEQAMELAKLRALDIELDKEGSSP